MRKMAFADSERRVRPRKDFSEDEASLASSLYSPVSEKNDDSEEFDAVANSEGEPVIRDHLDHLLS